MNDPYSYTSSFNKNAQIKHSQESLTDVFESSVEDLQLFLAEVGLLYEAVEPVRSVTHGGQLSIIIYTSCVEGWREKLNSYRKCLFLSKNNKWGDEGECE